MLGADRKRGRLSIRVACDSQGKCSIAQGHAAAHLASCARRRLRWHMQDCCARPNTEFDMCNETSAKVVAATWIAVLHSASLVPSIGESPRRSQRSCLGAMQGEAWAVWCASGALRFPVSDSPLARAETSGIRSSSVQRGRADSHKAACVCVCVCSHWFLAMMSSSLSASGRSRHVHCSTEAERSVAPVTLTSHALRYGVMHPGRQRERSRRLAI